VEALRALSARHQELTNRVRSVIVGQHDVVDQILVALFCQGHALLVGPPGVAKTLMVRVVAQSVSLSFQRVQFTPDMMPGDILGSEILQTDQATGERALRFVPGPIFTNVLLADEINRTPPKTQAALLEAMAEQQVSAGGATRPLDAPFFVFATQNPIEQEGTYPLPEAQLDRFMLSLTLTYPKANHERAVLTHSEEIRRRADAIEPIFDGRELVQIRDAIGRIPVTDHIVDYTLALIRATRPDDPTCPKAVKRYVNWGAGTRAGQALLLGARCLAAMEGEPTPSISHVQRLAPSVLRHRVLVNYAGSAEGIDADRVVEHLLREIPQPQYR
jgi:MoxR-like ATPase